MLTLRVLHQDSYVDDILTSHNDLHHLKSIVANVELILKAGFLLKPWVFSDLSGRGESEDEKKRSGFYQTKYAMMTTKHLA